jgi:hypothetical protein
MDSKIVNYKLLSFNISWLRMVIIRMMMLLLLLLLLGVRVRGRVIRWIVDYRL